MVMFNATRDGYLTFAYQNATIMSGTRPYGI